MLEAFATQLEDLLDRVGGLRETVATLILTLSLTLTHSAEALPSP